MGGFPGGSVVRNLPANAGDTRDTCLTHGSGHTNPLEKEMTTHASILAWTIPQIEKPGGLHHTAWLSFIELDKAVVRVIRLTSFL